MASEVIDVSDLTGNTVQGKFSAELMNSALIYLMVLCIRDYLSLYFTI